MKRERERENIFLHIPLTLWLRKETHLNFQEKNIFFVLKVKNGTLCSANGQMMKQAMKSLQGMTGKV